MTFFARLNCREIISLAGKVNSPYWPPLAKPRARRHNHFMNNAPVIDLSQTDAALAALSLLAALEPDAATGLEAYLPRYPQIDTRRAALIVPLIQDMAGAPDGVEAVFDLIADALPPHLSDTVYLLAADYVSAYGTALPEQMRLLERLAEALKLDRLTRAALDRAALVRSRAFDTEAGR